MLGRKTKTRPAATQQKREAEEDLVSVPTLGEVAEEADFEPLRKLLEPVKNRPVNELSAGLRSKLEKKGGEDVELLLESFFAACNVRVEEVSRKRAHVAFEEEAEGKLLFCFVFLVCLFLLFCSLLSLSARALRMCACCGLNVVICSLSFFSASSG